MRQRVSVFVFVRQMFRGYACVCRVCLSVCVSACIMYIICICVCVWQCVLSKRLQAKAGVAVTTTTPVRFLTFSDGGDDGGTKNKTRKKTSLCFGFN